VYLDLTRRLQRKRACGKAQAEESLDYTEQLEKALTVLKKRRFETAVKELDRIPIWGFSQSSAGYLRNTEGLRGPAHSLRKRGSRNPREGRVLRIFAKRGRHLV